MSKIGKGRRPVNKGHVTFGAKPRTTPADKSVIGQVEREQFLGGQFTDAQRIRVHIEPPAFCAAGIFIEVHKRNPAECFARNLRNAATAFRYNADRLPEIDNPFHIQTAVDIVAFDYLYLPTYLFGILPRPFYPVRAVVSVGIYEKENCLRHHSTIIVLAFKLI